jgi:hypothetical protein
VEKLLIDAIEQQTQRPKDKKSKGIPIQERKRNIL